MDYVRMSSHHQSKTTPQQLGKPKKGKQDMILRTLNELKEQNMK